MLIDIVIKTSKNKCSYSFGEMVLPGEITIRKKEGDKIEEIMVKGIPSLFNNDSSNKKVATNSLSGIGLINSLSFDGGFVYSLQSLEFILVWTFKDKEPDEEFNLTFQNIQYDPDSNPLSLGQGNKILSLSQFNWEKKNIDLWSVVDLGADKAVIKSRLDDFVNLVEKSNKNISLDQFISHLSEFEKYRLPENQELYELETFFKRSWAGASNKIFQEVIENKLKIRDELKLWKAKNIPNLSLKMIEQARENEFDLTKNDIEINSSGLYKGFSVFRTEKRKKLQQQQGFGFGGFGYNSEENCYTKTKIDLFRTVFPNNPDQSDPQYFRGFQPGDLARGQQENQILYISEKAVREKLTNHYIINPTSTSQTKTCLDLMEAKELNEFLEIACSNPTAYSEMPGANKSQHLNNYRTVINPSELNSDEKKALSDFGRELAELFLVLDKNYSAVDLNTCQKDLKYLKEFNEEGTLNEWGEKIRTRFQSEINAKIQAIENRITSHGSSLPDQIRNASQAEYGSNSTKLKKLSPERALIFTTHANEITTSELLDEIQNLLNLLIFVEEEKIKLNDSEGMSGALANLKNRWKNGSGDFKKAYEIVNKVDNQWADRLISQLESLVGNESNLSQKRTEFKTKWKDFVFATEIFDNPILDSISALEEADKLLVKVQTASESQETDASLLKELETYSEAPTGDIKNQAYQAVNSFQNQVEEALKHLREISKNRAKIIEGLQNAKTESELAAAYQKIKTSDFYQSEKNQKLTDKIHQRKKVCLEIAQDSAIPTAINQFLQTNLIKIIPDSIQNADDEKNLTELENELKTFSSDSPSGSKGKIYHQHKTIIEEILTEISQEKQRWSQINQPTPQPNSETKGFPVWAIGLVIGGLIISIGLAVYYLAKKKKKNSGGFNPLTTMNISKRDK